MNDKRKFAVRVRAGALAKALADVVGIVSGRDVIPILSHVLLVAGDGSIALTATDLDLFAVRTLASDDQDGPGSKEWLASIRPFSVTLPAKALAAVIKHFDGDAMVTIEAPDVLNAKWAGQVVVKAGRARFKLNALPVADFPAHSQMMPDARNFDIPAAELSDVLAKVEHAISTEETRYYLNGIYMHPAQVAGEPLTLNFAATDGHRLSRVAICPPDGAASFPAMIIGRATVALLGKLLQAAEKASEGAIAALSADAEGRRIGVELPASDGGEVRIVAKAIEGTFPDYSRVIPSGGDIRAVIERGVLHEALGRISVMCGDKTRCIRAEFGDDRLTLSVTNAELGEGSEELPCDYAGPASGIIIGFNGNFWREALDAVPGDQVLMRLSDAGGPGLIVDAGAAKASDGEPAGLPPCAGVDADARLTRRQG